MFSRLNLYCAAVAGLICLSWLPPARAQAAAPAPDPSLRLHLDFQQDFSNGRVPDVTGNGHDGWQFCPTNWITATNGVFAGTGAAWHTNGTALDELNLQFTSQYIGVTNLTGIDYLTNGTISFWAQFGQGSDVTTVMLDAGYPAMYAFYPDLATNSWTLRRNYRPYLNFVVFDAAADQRTIVNWPTDVVQPYGPSADLSTTNYHLYTLTFSCSSNQAIAYYDGQPFMTNSIGLPWLRIYCSTPWLAIGVSAHDGTPEWGAAYSPHSGFFDGKMDDLRIYNRALSAAEVQNLYVGNTFAGPLTIQTAEPQSVQLSWPSVLGASYQLETCPSPSSSSWSPVGSPVFGTGSTNTLLDAVDAKVMGFYRVRLLP